MMTLDRRCHILAWTSLWIYVPFFIWCRLRIAPLYCAALLPVSGTISILHWKNNRTGDWRHRLDIFVAVLLCGILTYQLLITGRYVICTVLVFGQLGFFCRQRYIQRYNPVCWRETTQLHLMFRYIGFWLAMAVHMPHSGPLLFIALSISYMLHIVMLGFSF
jgi:hypothetical protein